MVESYLQIIDDPAPDSIAETPLAFLRQLKGPTLIRIRGQDSSRCRAVVTLLHGNEPSGVRALHRLLAEGMVPRTNLLVFIVSIHTALTLPLFSYRQLPDERDMNRCFMPPYDDWQGRLAADIRDHLSAAAPEAVLDIHNTSGDGPCFAVCTETDPVFRDLASLFTHRLVITDIRLGALMETAHPGHPVITIECGGSGQTHAHEIALSGLRRFVEIDQLFGIARELDMDIYHHPVRLELRGGARITYADQPDSAADITLPVHIDRNNFGVATPDLPLAWLGEDGLKPLRLSNSSGEFSLEEFFTVRDNRLYPAQTLKLFMVTTDPRIASSDCLLYAVRERDHDHENH